MARVTLPDTSDAAPALASHNGRLYLAWKGSGNPQLNIEVSDDGGHTFGRKMVFSDTTQHGPALVSHEGQLILAWTREGANHLDVATVSLPPDGSIGPFSQPDGGPRRQKRRWPRAGLPRRTAVPGLAGTQRSRV